MSGAGIYQVVIEKYGYGEYWVNDYHVVANSPSDAADKLETIVAIEKAVHANTVAFTKGRVRQAGSTAQGTVYPLSGTGALNQATDVLPLYNTIRVDFAPQLGRVGRKYLRQPIFAGGSVNGILKEVTQTYINQNYVEPLLALGYLCKSLGQVFVYGNCTPNVQMRQLRRGSKRKLQPII